MEVNAMNVRGARVLITGASSGIGRATAEALAAEGALLAVSGRRVTALEELAKTIVAAGGARPVILPTDLARPGAAEQLVADAIAALGSLDVLINNAAVEGEGLYSDTTDHFGARGLFEINYWSPMALIQAVIPSMRERKSGAIVNVSSLGAITPIPDTGHYPSAKAALAVATEALRAELRHCGVQVVLVYPGLVETPMLQAFRARPRLLPRWRRSLRMMPVGRPEKLAQLIVKALRRGRKTVVYPRSFALAPHFPSFSRWFTGLLFPAPLGLQGASGSCRWLRTFRTLSPSCCTRARST
jgi:short-subunit dehydrogenase